VSLALVALLLPLLTASPAVTIPLTSVFVTVVVMSAVVALVERRTRGAPGGTLAANGAPHVS
jgi:hypothetical protein